MKKDGTVWIVVVMAFFAVALYWILFFGIEKVVDSIKEAEQTKAMVGGIVTYAESGKGEKQQYISAEPYEDPNESEKIAAAVIATIGTEREQECFGYDATYVLKMLTAECGDDGDLCWAVATAIFNECVKLNNRYTPVDVISGSNDANYHLTAEPADFISEAALTYFCKVFVRCDLCPEIGKANVFYNPELVDGVPFHETQEYVTTISGVRFFREVE